MKKQTVKVLTTKYTIEMQSEKKNKELKGFGGYTNFYKKEIKLNSINRKNKAYLMQVIRHELIHAFLFESGLDVNSCNTYGGWARNEEMVDWLAIQMPKIMKAFKKLGV